MANAIDDALNRASPEKKQAIENLKSQVASAENSNPANTPASAKQPTLDPQTQSNIESIQQGPGNNYLYQNAIDRARSRPSQEPEKSAPESEKER